MGQAGSVTCGHTVHKESKHNKLSLIHQHDIESKYSTHHIIEDENTTDQYQHHNPLYNQYATNDLYPHTQQQQQQQQQRHSIKSIKRTKSKSKKHHSKHNSIPNDNENNNNNTNDSDNNVMDDINQILKTPKGDNNNNNINNSKRRIKYRERHETLKGDPNNNINKMSMQYMKYKKYKKLRSKYIKMDGLLHDLLSLNAKNLQHILMLRKTDNININNFYKYIMNNGRDNRGSNNNNNNNISLHLPQLKKVQESLSFYAVSFKPINNSRKLWHILLQDRSHPNVIINESLIRSWISQLLLAVHFLHLNNIVHLDISPESIIICNNNRLILSGFDASMLVNDHITYNINCELLNNCWQLPPAIRRRNDFNGFEFKTFDMWSIGVLTFLLLTAKFPFFKDKNSKRIPESSYVLNEKCISHSGRDFISKLLSSNITNRLTIQSALQHKWIKHTHIHTSQTITIDGSIYSSMHKHHQSKLNNKYSIVQKQTKEYLFITDQKKLNKKIKKLNRKINKYSQSSVYNDDDIIYDKSRRKSRNIKGKRSSINISKSHTKYLTYNDYCDAETDSNNSNSLIYNTNITQSDTDISNTSSPDISDDNTSPHYIHINKLSNKSSSSSLGKNKQKQKLKKSKTYSNNHSKKLKKKRRGKHHSDSLRSMDNRYDIKKRNRSNSQHTYSEYRERNNNVNKIDVEKWQDIKSGDEDENIKKHNSIDILSPLNNHNEQYPSTTHTNNHLSPSHNHNQQNVNRYSHNHTHNHTHFVRSNHSNVHQLTPTNTKKNISNNIPLYSRGSGHQTNVTTPNLTSSSTQYNNNNDNDASRFKYKIKHQHKTSYGNLIAIERSIGPNSSPKQSPKLNSNRHINKYQYDMLTGNSINNINNINNINKQKQININREEEVQKHLIPHNIRQIPRRPLLPPKIIKLDSPSVTINGNLSSSSSEKEQIKHKQKTIQIIHKQRRSFQITRRPLSPPNNPIEHTFDHNHNHNHKPRVPNMPLISNSAPTNTLDDKHHIDFLSDVISNEHPINEYDPLDLNDSAIKKSRWTPQQLPTKHNIPSPSPPPHNQKQQTMTYPVLSIKNLSLHQLHLSRTKKSLDIDCSGSSRNSRNSNDTNRLHVTTGHTKDLSGSGSGLILHNIVKNQLLRAPENSDSNFTSNSKAILIKESSHENTKSNENIIIQPDDNLELTDSQNNLMDLNAIDLNVKPTRSALDILKIHQNGNNNQNDQNNQCDYLTVPNDNDDKSIRSSVISLENILQERGLFKKTDVKILRDVELDKDKRSDHKSNSKSHSTSHQQNEEQQKPQMTHIRDLSGNSTSNINGHHYTNTDSIDDSMANRVIHGIIPDEEESKIEESNDFIVSSPKDNYSFDSNIDDIGMYAQLDPNLLINNPGIHLRHVHNNKKRKTIRDGRVSTFTFDSDNNNITPISISDYKQHSDIHYNIQQQIDVNDNDNDNDNQSETQSSQSEIIHPSIQQQQNNQIINNSPNNSLPITSPYKHVKLKHHFYGSSNLHNKRRSLYNNNNNNNNNNNKSNNIMDNDTIDSMDEDQSSLSALSPNNIAVSPPVVSNTNNSNQSGQLNTFHSRNRNNNHLYVDKFVTDNSSTDSTPNQATGQNDTVCDGRTSTY